MDDNTTLVCLGSRVFRDEQSSLACKPLIDGSTRPQKREQAPEAKRPMVPRCSVAPPAAPLVGWLAETLFVKLTPIRPSVARVMGPAERPASMGAIQGMVSIC